MLELFLKVNDPTRVEVDQGDESSSTDSRTQKTNPPKNESSSETNNEVPSAEETKTDELDF